LLVRVLARECLMFDPNAYQLNARALVDGTPVRSEIEFISDSDDFFAVSLMPLGKDMDWCLQRQKVEQTWLARWWLHYDSKLNDLVAATKVRIHYAEPTKSEWNKAEMGSDLFVHRAAVYREALRVWRALPELKCERSAELLAMAMQNGAIQHLTQRFGRLVIFVPSDDGIDLIPEQRLAAIVHGSNGHRLKDLIRRHLVLLAEDEDDLDTSLARGPQAELTALDGRKIVVSKRQNGSDAPQLIVNGKYPISAMIPSGPNLIVRLEGNLLTDASLPLRSAHRFDDSSQAKGITS
jgi:fasciclin domain-containing protein